MPKYLKWNPREDWTSPSGPRMKFKTDGDLSIMAYLNPIPDVSKGDGWCQVIVHSSRNGTFTPRSPDWAGWLSCAEIIKSYIGWARDLELCCVDAGSGVAQYSFASPGSSYYEASVSREFREVIITRELGN